MRDLAHPRACSLATRDRTRPLSYVATKGTRFAQRDFVGASWRSKTRVFSFLRGRVWGVRATIFYSHALPSTAPPFLRIRAVFFGFTSSLRSNTPLCQAESELRAEPSRGRGLRRSLQNRPSRFSPTRANFAKPSKRRRRLGRIRVVGKKTEAVCGVLMENGGERCRGMKSELRERPSGPFP